MNARKLSTTTYPINFFMVDSADHLTGKTGLTVTVTLSKNGAAFGAASGSVSEIASGWYSLAGNATDRNTLGELLLHATAAGADATDVQCAIVTHDPFAMPADVRTEMDNNSAQLAAIVEGLGNLAVGSGGISVTASSFTKSGAEPETNTYTATAAGDGVYHIVEDVANTTDAYYQFNVGSSGVPQSVEWKGYAQSNGDSYALYFYNWVTTAWEQVGTITAANGTTPTSESFAATTSHVGTGSNVGLVRFRFYSTTGTAFATDRLLCTYTQVQSGIANGSTITLTASTVNANYIGHGWKLALGGQIISGSYFNQAILVTGTATCTNGSPPIFQECAFGAASISAEAFLDKCALGDTLTLTSTAGVSADTIDMSDCFSNVAGPSAPVLDLSGITKTTYINIRRWSGGLRLTLTADCTVSVDTVSGGTITINGTGGVVNVRGIVEGVTDNTGGAATITKVATLNRDFVADAVWDELLTGATHNIATSAGRKVRELASGIIHTGTCQTGNTINTIVLDNDASTTDGAYDPSEIALTAGTGIGQSRLILQYTGATRTAVIDRDWKTIPDATTEFAISTNPGREHVNEGLAQGGTTNTITLNTLASAADDAYNGQIVFIRSGTGEDQSRWITDYDGATKVAIVNEAWDTTPDTTSAYVMLPTGMQNLTLPSTAQVKTQIVDALTVDTYAELSSVPAATSSLKDKINWLFALARNKLTSTSSTATLRNDGDSASIATSVQSDDSTTFTRGEWS